MAVAGKVAVVMVVAEREGAERAAVDEVVEMAVEGTTEPPAGKVVGMEP